LVIINIAKVISSKSLQTHGVIIPKGLISLSLQTHILNQKKAEEQKKERRSSFLSQLSFFFYIKDSDQFSFCFI